MDLATGGSQGRRLLVQATEAEDLMARRDQLRNDGRANESSRTGNKHTHEQGLQGWLETNLGADRILVKS
jgi:hypothetical protein